MTILIFIRDHKLVTKFNH